MSEVLNKIDINDYGVQKMVGGGGGSSEDLTTVLNAQDSALSTQVSKIAQLETALDNKIALDLQEATSDATAVAGDIAQGKTAYVNGIKVTGTVTPNDNNAKVKTIWENAGQGVKPRVCHLIKELPAIDLTNANSISGIFSDCFYLEVVPDLTNISSSITDMGACFQSCRNIKSLKLIDTSNITNMNYMCEHDIQLENVPIFNTASLQYMNGAFTDCPLLTNDSLNNIMKMCINASNYTGTKALKNIGLSSTQATTCQSLSNYSDFVNAGWTTGY